MKICFHTFSAELQNYQVAPSCKEILVRRLSTESLHAPSRLNLQRQCALRCTQDAPDSQPTGTEYLTQWQWFYMDHAGWILFSRVSVRCGRIKKEKVRRVKNSVHFIQHIK